eukprot:9504138-Pyramimonas_sp.AAC.2
MRVPARSRANSATRAVSRRAHASRSSDSIEYFHQSSFHRWNFLRLRVTVLISVECTCAPCSRSRARSRRSVRRSARASTTHCGVL